MAWDARFGTHPQHTVASNVLLAGLTHSKYTNAVVGLYTDEVWDPALLVGMLEAEGLACRDSERRGTTIPGMSVLTADRAASIRFTEATSRLETEFEHLRLTNRHVDGPLRVEGQQRPAIAAVLVAPPHTWEDPDRIIQYKARPHATP